MTNSDAKTLIRSISVLIIVMLLVGFLVIKTRKSQFVLAQSQKPVRQNEKPKPENNYLFSEATPGNNWLVQVADFDLSQIENPDIPVVIVGIRSYVGKGNWRKHIMIESVVLKNRSAKALKAFRLGWFIMTAGDREAGKNREAALVQGYSDLIPADSA